MMWWRTRDSLSHMSQCSDSHQNQGGSLISLLFSILMVVKNLKEPFNLNFDVGLRTIMAQSNKNINEAFSKLKL